MKTTSRSTITRNLTAALLLAGATFAHATTIGLPTSGSSFATWDTFTGASFTDASPDSESTASFSSTLTSSIAPPAMTLGDGDRIYSNVNSFNLTIDGNVTGSTNTLAVQIKFTSGAGAAATNFDLSLAGTGAGTQTFLGTTTEDAGTFNVYQWSWDGLGLESSDSFSINATSSNQHTSLDAIRISNVAAVPEPGTIVLLSVALGAFFIFRRRLATR